MSMSQYKWTLSLLILLAAAAGCSETNPAYTDPDTDPDAPACRVNDECGDPDRPVCLDGTCVGCASDDDCPADSPVCEAETLTCTGECRDSGDCAADEPVCDDEMATCRGCEADAECDSLLCNEDIGTCVNELEVVYVAVDGDDGGTCTVDAPCKTLARAVDVATHSRSTIHVSAGTYAEAVVIAKSVSVFGAEASLVPASDDAAIMHVTSGADVLLEGLELRGAAARSVGVVECSALSSLTLRGVRVADNGWSGVVADGCQLDIAHSEITGNDQSAISTHDSTVIVRDTRLDDNGNSGARLGAGTVAELVRVDVTGNDLRGIYATGADVTVRQSNLVNNAFHGVYANESSKVRIERSVIVGNGGSGLTAGSTEVMLFNNFFVDNGGDSATDHGGAIRLSDTVALTSRVEHNTIVGNDSTLPEYPAGGIACGGALTITLRNNIVHGNTGDEVSGSCSHEYSLLSSVTESMSGAHNIIAQDAGFRGGGDYHISSGSPAVSKASQMEDVTEDFDAERRSDGLPDIGADELAAQ